VAVGVIAVINALLCGLVWRHLFVKPKFDTVINEDATINIVGELDNYYHQEVQFQFLSRLNGSQLANHVIEIFSVDSTCNSLPKTANVTSYEESNNTISEHQNFNHLYLLPKSTLSYTVTPVNASILDINNITSEQAVIKIEDVNRTISLQFRIGKTCLIAYTNTNNSSPPCIHLEARVIKMQTLMVLVTTAVPSTVVTLMILACVIVTGCCCLRIKSRKRQLQEYSTIEEALSEYVTIQ
jgi:hypothetical protein